MSPADTVPWTVWLLFAAPLAALVMASFLRLLKPRWTALPILASCAVVTACAAALTARAYAGWELDASLFTWMPAFDWPVTFGVRIDGISAAMLLMVSVVGALIHLYSLGYMKEDPGIGRFMMYFHLFYLAMIGMIVSNNYVQFYLFWEGVGVASYLLISFWTHKPGARRAALQAFMTNRVGDAGFLFALLILMSLFRDTRFTVVFGMLSTAHPALLTFAGILLVWAAAAKSAQFPLYFWLPDAMEGPTPASALMHAATMVTAGIYLLIRSWPIVSAVEGLPELLAMIGAFTAVAAGVLAFVQTDLKRILAYSTVSHLGLMAFSLGLHQVGAALFHLVTHGFFKAALFLCAGNIAHGLGKSTALVTDVGGLRHRMPLTFYCFLLSSLSLAGLWPAAGHYSKDAVLEAALHAGGWASAAGLAIAFLSGLYIFRMLFLTFFSGPGRVAQIGARPHEAHDAVMTVPLVFLAMGALGVGWLQGAFSTLILTGALIPVESLRIMVAGSAAIAGTLMTALAAVAAHHLFIRRPDWDWDWRKARPGLEAVLFSDFGWRRVISWLAGAVSSFSHRLSLRWDQGLVDAFVESSARLSMAASRAGGTLATGSLNDYLWWMMAGIGGLFLLQWGAWVS